MGKSVRDIIRNQLGQDGILLYLVRDIDEQIGTLERGLRQVDLSNEEGVRKAIGFQHRIKGLEQAIGLIFTLAEPEFKQDD